MRVYVGAMGVAVYDDVDLWISLAGCLYALLADIGNEVVLLVLFARATLGANVVGNALALAARQTAQQPFADGMTNDAAIT